MASSLTPSIAVAPMRKPFQYVWKPPAETCYRGLYRWEDEAHAGWKEALQAFQYKVGQGCGLVGCVFGSRPCVLVIFLGRRPPSLCWRGVSARR